jgi:MoaA/NifB/PqqE/SkfB family radical SAM enzyme
MKPDKMNVLQSLVPYKLILIRRKLIPIWKKLTKENLRVKSRIPILHVHLVDHCNLNCRGCDNFSPLSNKVFADSKIFENDCARIAKLSNGKIDEIQLLGGEPLLHPQVIDFMKIARSAFPSNTISIVSNGILLPKMKEDFWNCCKENNISIIVTKYPINIDYTLIEKKIKAKGIAYTYYGNTESVDKSMQCLPLDIDGKQNPLDSFLRCSRANRCISLDNGKLYTCSLIPYVNYFNSYFDKNLKITDSDFIDIYKVKSIDEILDFVAKPMPFCKYCNLKDTIWDIGFGISKKEISEWTGKTN